MPEFGSVFSDSQIIAILAYIRGSMTLVPGITSR